MHRVIFVARHRGAAFALKNLLASHGIAAHVTNDHSGGDVYLSGQSQSAALSIVVADQDAQRARQIVEDAELAMAEGQTSPELARLEAEEGDEADWPDCPHCHRPRLTSCPVCETAGTHFAEAFLPEDVPQTAGGPSGPARPLMVICPTCDEPFAPQFPARCEWCGHRFGDGYEPPPVNLQETPPFLASETSSLAGVVILGLAVFLAAVFGWFYYILY